MTLLVASVVADTGPQMRALAEKAFANGADVVELRLDGLAALDEPLMAWVSGLPPGRWIVTCRSAAEGGASRESATERAAHVLKVRATRDAYVDAENQDFAASPEVRQLILAALAAQDRPSGERRLILSHHDFAGRPESPAKTLAAIAQEPKAIPKVAWMPTNICDNLEALELVRSSAVPAIAIGMGEAGLMSRVLAKKVGAFASYCSVEAGRETAPGQVTLDDMLHRYRWGTMNSATRFFGVIGWPVAHSMSPVLHNAAFARADLNAVYLPLAVEPAGRTLEHFLDGCLEHPWLDSGGFSVTVPHKSRVLAYLGDQVDDLARRIGAVNTLAVSNGRYRGYNTDHSGALDALADGLGCERDDLRGTAVDVLGAGGAARAVVAGLCEYGCRVTICNIIPEDAASLADEFGTRLIPWDRRDRGGGSILVNCTSVGMWPEVDHTPFPAEGLSQYDAVFDVVYNPLQTRLLREAAAAGCRTVAGVEMFVHQAAEQFRLWTGQEPDKTLMRNLVVAELAKNG
jgi:3-dehydroquinate dehydratase/shikimate dehydrogenase